MISDRQLAYVKGVSESRNNIGLMPETFNRNTDLGSLLSIAQTLPVVVRFVILVAAPPHHTRQQERCTGQVSTKKRRNVFRNFDLNWIDGTDRNIKDSKKYSYSEDKTFGS